MRTKNVSFPVHATTRITAVKQVSRDTAAVTQQQRSLPSLNAGQEPAMEKQHQQDTRPTEPALRCVVTLLQQLIWKKKNAAKGWRTL